SSASAGTDVSPMANAMLAVMAPSARRGLLITGNLTWGWGVDESVRRAGADGRDGDRVRVYGGGRVAGADRREVPAIEFGSGEGPPHRCDQSTAAPFVGGREVWEVWGDSEGSGASGRERRKDRPSTASAS